MTLALDRAIVYPESDGQPMADNTDLPSALVNASPRIIDWVLVALFLNPLAPISKKRALLN